MERHVSTVRLPPVVESRSVEVAGRTVNFKRYGDGSFTHVFVNPSGNREAGVSRKPGITFNAYVRGVSADLEIYLGAQL